MDWVTAEKIAIYQGQKKTENDRKAEKVQKVEQKTENF